MTSSSDNPTQAASGILWQWVVLSVGLIGALAFAVAHAPPGWQRPGPTALWFSIASGIVIGGIAAAHRIVRRRVVFVTAFLIIALSLIGMTGERYRLYVKSLESLYLSRIVGQSPEALAQAMRSGHVLDELIGELHEYRRAIYEDRRPFRVFLAYRLEALGIDQEPWPLVFWLGEITLGAVLGAFTATRWHKWQMEAQDPAIVPK